MAVSRSVGGRMGSQIDKRRLSGIDRSGPPPAATLSGHPLDPWTLPNLIDYLRLLGIPVARYRTLMFAIGGALAGFGGAIAAPLLPVQVNMGSTVLLQSFMIVIIGGIGNVVGAIVASVALGLLQAFGQTFAPDWVAAATYALMAAVLLVRPQGLFTRSAGRRA